MSTLAAENRRILVRLSIAAMAMFGFGFALVPFYDVICRVTGLRNLDSADAAPISTQVDTSRAITVEFDANIHNMPWRFRPLQTSVRVHPGQLVRVDYEVQNTLDRPVTGQAVPSYGPAYAAQHFRKIDCFCFRQQTLAAGEKRVMPVAFTLDGKLPAEINTITLSYTFFEVAGTAGKPAATPRG